MQFAIYKERGYNVVDYFTLMRNVVILGDGHPLRVLESMVLRKISGHLRDEETGDCKKLHNELSDLNCLAGIIRVIEWRMMRWAEHVARMGGGEQRTERVSMRKPDGDNFEDLGVEERLKLKWIFGKQNGT
jgi:hypothetical protein